MVTTIKKGGHFMKVQLKDNQKFRTLLVLKGFTQRSFGRSIGVSESYASQIINGTRNPGPKIAKKIADKLEVEFNDIFLVIPVTKVTYN